MSVHRVLLLVCDGESQSGPQSDADELALILLKFTPMVIFTHNFIKIKSVADENPWVDPYEYVI